MLAVHENFRFEPWYQAIHRLLQDDTLGTVYQISLRSRPGDGRVWLRKHAESDEQKLEFNWQDRGFAGDSVYRYQAHVLAHLKDGAPLTNSARDYLRNMQIVEAVYRSNDLGQWQTP